MSFLCEAWLSVDREDDCKLSGGGGAGRDTVIKKSKYIGKVCTNSSEHIAAFSRLEEMLCN